MTVKIKIKKKLHEENEGSIVEPKETLKAYSYCSIILDQSSQKTLKTEVEKLKPQGFLNADEAVDKKLSHHITINMGTSIKFPEYTNGQRVEFSVVKYLEHKNEKGEGVAAVSVTPTIKTASGNPHITVFLNNMNPGKAADLKVGGKVPPTKELDLNIQGLIGYVNIPSQVQ